MNVSVKVWKDYKNYNTYTVVYEYNVKGTLIVTYVQCSLFRLGERVSRVGVISSHVFKLCVLGIISRVRQGAQITCPLRNLLNVHVDIAYVCMYPFF